MRVQQALVMFIDSLTISSGHKYIFIFWMLQISLLVWQALGKLAQFFKFMNRWEKLFCLFGFISEVTFLFLPNFILLGNSWELSSVFCIYSTILLFYFNTCLTTVRRLSFVNYFLAICSFSFAFPLFPALISRKELNNSLNNPSEQRILLHFLDILQNFFVLRWTK